jgi:hypothetical protein
MTRLLLFVIAVLIAALGVQRLQGNRARARALAAALSMDSAQAAHDTTREMELARLHDSVRVFVRRAEQQEQRADALDHDLDAQRLSRINAQLRVAALDTTVRAEAPGDVRPEATRIARGGKDDGSRRTRFIVRHEPYTVVGEISGRSTTADDTVSLHVDMDSIPLELRLSCQAARDTPVRRALVVAVAPPWARVALAVVEQSPSVCNHELTRRGAYAGVRHLLARAGISAGAGVVVTNTGQVVVRPALLVGLRLWP